MVLHNEIEDKGSHLLEQGRQGSIVSLSSQVKEQQDMPERRLPPETSASNQVHTY